MARGQCRRRSERQHGLKLWIDTDGGVDDALAIACALAAPDVELVGISAVFGNVAPRRAARNAALVQSFFPGPACPVWVGATRPLVGTWRDARTVHGPDGLGGATAQHELPFEEQVVLEAHPEETAHRLATFAREAGPEGRLVCIGPLTHLAVALSRHPGAFDRLGGIVCMGGTLSIPRPRRGDAEFNFSSDLEATRGVLAQAPRLLILPLDTCRRVVLRRARLARIAKETGSGLTRFLRRAHTHYMDFYLEREGIDGCYPHDALAVALAVAGDEIFSVARHDLELDTQQGFPGLLSPSPQGRPLQVATGVDLRAALNWIETCLRGSKAD